MRDRGREEERRKENVENRFCRERKTFKNSHSILLYYPKYYHEISDIRNKEMILQVIKEEKKGKAETVLVLVIHCCITNEP